MTRQEEIEIEKEAQNNRRHRIAASIAASFVSRTYPSDFVNDEVGMKEQLAKVSYEIADALIKEGKRWKPERESVED